MLDELEFPLSAPRKLVSGNLCTPSLNRKTWNEVLGSAFVNISTTCNDDGRKQVIKTPLQLFPEQNDDPTQYAWNVQGIRDLLSCEGH